MKSEDGPEKRVHHSQLRPWKKSLVYLLQSCRCVHDLSSVALDSSLQGPSAVGSAEWSQDASRTSPRQTLPRVTSAGSWRGGRGVASGVYNASAAVLFCGTTLIPPHD